MGDFLFGEDPSIQYAQSPQQSQAQQLTMPLLQKMFGQALGQPYISGYETRTIDTPASGGQWGWQPQMNDFGYSPYTPGSSQQMQIPTYTTPQAGDMNLWNIPNAYNIPQAVAPTSGWFNSLSPEVMQGLWEPYEQGASQLAERMGAAGMSGSARGGYSGTAGDAFGRYYSDASKNIGTQAWNMTSPGMMANWGAQLGQGQEMWNAQLNQNMAPWNMLQGIWGASLPNTVVDPGSQGLVSQLAPFAMMGLMG